MPKLKIDPLSLVDLDLYPLSDAQKRAQIVDAARASLAALGSAVLPGFVTAAGIAMMTKEALALATLSHRRDRMLGAYPDETPKVSDPTHPVNRTSLYRMNVTATDQMDPSGATLALYEWPELTSFVADILCRPVLYLVEDPMMRCNFTFLGPGDAHGWHFDGNDFVVSLLIQDAEEGGEFEFAPNLRTPENPNFEGVRDVMDERPGTTRKLRAKPGTLALFRGRRALHRVTEVRGDRNRIIALLSYHDRPGLVNGAAAQRRVFGRAFGETVVT